MSREIKFRVWSEKDNTYVKMGSIVVNTGIDTEFTLKDGAKYTVEQYTGLKETNGKEIYEGDIVKARWYRAKHARLDTKGEVKFADGWFYIADDPDGQDRLGVPVHNCYSIDVIGNIHENPESLGGEE